MADTSDIDRTIDALHAIRLAQAFAGNGPPGQALAHEAVRVLSTNAPSGTVQKAVADALMAHFRLSLSP